MATSSSRRARDRPADEADRQTEQEPVEHGTIPVQQHHALDLAGGGAERHPHADLARAIGDDVRLDAVETRHREKERDRAEADRREAEPAHDLERSGEHRASRPDPVDRDVRIRAPDRLAHRAHGGRHRSGCARDDRDERLIVLLERRVGERPRIREEAAHVRVGRDADDGGRRARGRLAGERDLPSDGVGGSKICRAVNSLTMRTRGAPGPSRSSKPRPRRISTPSVRKIDGVAATAVTMRGGVSAAPACSAGAIETQRARHAEGQSARERRRFDRRMAAQFAEQTIERPPRARLAPLRPVEIEDRDPDPIQIDAGVVPRFRDRALHEHRRDDEEPGRDRDLPPQQGALAPAARRPGVDPAASAPRTSIVRVSWIAGSRPKTTSATRSDDTATPNAVTFSTG